MTTDLPGCERVRLSDYDYELPEELIASRPAERGNSRLLILDREKGNIEDALFSELPNILNYPLTICRNITAVVKTRIFARKSTGGAVELLILNPYERGPLYESLIHRGGKLKEGEILTAGENYSIRVAGRKENIFFVEPVGCTVDEIMENCGHVPLPPYIKRCDEKSDETDYQTVFAKEKGSSAAPTAGLHFSEEILGLLKSNGAQFADILLHVGLGTFLPVKSEYADEHRMHSEYFNAGREACGMLNVSKEKGIPILCIGTTALRALETIYDKDEQRFREGEGKTDIFIYPPHKVESCEMLITNFHLPKSTLLMLVSAFAGRENIMRAYAHAIEKRYRFFSYGDAMLIR